MNDGMEHPRDYRTKTINEEWRKVGFKGKGTMTQREVIGPSASEGHGI